MAVIITSAVLGAVRVNLETRFRNAFDKVPTQRGMISEEVTSTSSENVYDWLNELPHMREWIGPRVVHGLSESLYRLPNKDFEYTIGVPRTKIEDDTVGTFGKRFEMMGRAAALFPEELVWRTLAAGFTASCWDGQPFFDTAHPVIREDGSLGLYANTDGGAGPAWFLMDTTQVVMPIIEQVRKRPEFVARDRLEDDNVFFNKEFVYGTDARGNAGYTFPQLCWGSRQPLTAASYEAARTAMGSYRADYGRPLGIVPNLLVVPAALEGAARRILKNELVGGGNTNEWAGTADVLVARYL